MRLHMGHAMGLLTAWANNPINLELSKSNLKTNCNVLSKRKTIVQILIILFTFIYL